MKLPRDEKGRPLVAGQPIMEITAQYIERMYSEEWPSAAREFKIGDRVRINYGLGTVIDYMSARDGVEACVVVHADIGQAWFRRPEDVELLPAGDPE